MQKSRGIIVGLLLTGLLTGCHSATDTQTPTVQPATSKVSAVRSVTTRDFLGRWVSARPAMSLYLSTNHQVAWFRRGHTPIRSRATLTLSDTRATFTIDHNVAKLTLNDANQMTMNYQETNIALIKDPNWQPEHNQVPTTTNDALKAGTLTPTFKLSY